MIPVAYDSEIFLLQEYGGVSRYFSSLIEEFLVNPIHGIQPVLSFAKSNNLYLQELKKKSLIDVDSLKFPYMPPTSPWKTLLTWGPIHHGWLALSANAKVKSADAKTLHCTYYRPSYIEQARSEQKVVTVHDFIPERLDWKGVKNPHIGKRRLCRSASLIFCVSQTTAQDLQEFFGISDSRVKVIGHGVSHFGEVHKRSVRSGRAKVLYVGHRGGYKNFKVLSQAAEILDDEGVEIEICTVGPVWTEEESRYFVSRFRNITWKQESNVSDQRLTELYSENDLLCFTSKMEGFGLPILEALAMGTRVLASDIPVFHEVGGEMINYFNPDSRESLSEKIRELLVREPTENEIKLRIEYARE